MSTHRKRHKGRKFLILNNEGMNNENFCKRCDCKVLADIQLFKII